MPDYDIEVFEWQNKWDGDGEKPKKTVEFPQPKKRGKSETKNKSNPK